MLRRAFLKLCALAAVPWGRRWRTTAETLPFVPLPKNPPPMIQGGRPISRTITWSVQEIAYDPPHGPWLSDACPDEEHRYWTPAMSDAWARKTLNRLLETVHAA